MKNRKSLLSATRAPKPPSPPPGWWQRQIQERPFALAGTIMTMIGGLITLIFFLQRGIYPDLDLASAGSILLAVATVSLMLSLGITGCTFGIGMMMQGTGELLKFFSKPLNTLWLAAPGWLTVCLACVTWWYDEHANIPPWTWFLPFILSVGIAWYISGKPCLTKYGQPGVATLPRFYRLGRALVIFVIGFAWISIGASASLMFWAFRSPGLSANSFLFGIALWTTICYLMNMGIATANLSRFRDLAIGSIACGIFGMLALITLTKNELVFPAAVMRSLTLGEMPVALVVDEDGCEEINAASGSSVCRMALGSKRATVCPVLLRSRIGSPYFVEVSPYATDGHWPEEAPPVRMIAIALDRKVVKSWSRISPMPAASAPGSRASDAVATYLDPAQTGAWLREQCGVPPK